MKQVIIFFLAVIGGVVLSAFSTMRWMESRPSAAVDPHEWLHAELKVTAEQHATLAPIEARFAKQNRVLRERMRAANHDLALAIAKGRPDSPEIAAAVGKIHLRMGDLQKASIEHIFEMRSALTPDQGNRLLKLAQQALDESP